MQAKAGQKRIHGVKIRRGFSRTAGTSLESFPVQIAAYGPSVDVVSARPLGVRAQHGGEHMGNNIFYIIGVIVVVGAVVSWLT
jgi:hypothetical protein